MSTAAYVCLLLLGITLNIAGAVAVAIFKRKGLIPCEADPYRF